MKTALRSIKDVYSRLKWDGSIDTTHCSIGYQDRQRGLVEMPFSEFRPGGRVPWDRIQYFRIGERRVWDRLSRLDYIFGSGDTPQGAQLLGQDSTQAPSNGWPLLPSQAYDHEAARWLPAHKAHTPPASRWRILSLNLLADAFLPEPARKADRYPQLLDWILGQDADLVALQEVDKDMLARIQAHPAVQQHYHLATNHGQGKGRSHHELILSKAAPTKVQAVLVDEDVRALVASFNLRGKPLHIACLHMFSELAHNHEERRRRYLQAIVGGVPPHEPMLLVGDYNLREGVPMPGLEAFKDAWLELHPGDPGITFDGPNNALALAIKPSGAHRLDRILVRTTEDFPRVERLQKQEPQFEDGSGPLSDHYALLAELSIAPTFGSMRGAPKTNHAALCLIPPTFVWNEVQALRQEHDPAFSRWMPHLNMVYGFIPEPYHEEAAAALNATLADEQPFELTLVGFEVFAHKDSTTVYLKPDQVATNHLRRLQSKANKLFPQCDDQQRHGAFHPHLTVAKFPNSRKKDLHRYLAEWNAAWQPLSFTVNALSLIARTEVSAFDVTAEVTLGSAGNACAHPQGLIEALGRKGLLLGKLGHAERAKAQEKVAAGITAMKQELLLLPTGSTALGTALPGSDLDFVCIGRIPADEFLPNVHRRMDSLQHARIALDSLVPTAKLQFTTFSADISYVELTLGQPLQPPTEWSEAQLAMVSDGQVRGLQAAIDAARLRAMAGDEWEAFVHAAIALKAWAKARGVIGNAYGFPGGYAWTLLLAQAQPAETPEAWLKAGFEYLLQRDWSGTPAGETEQAPFLLNTPGPHPFNATRNVTPRTKALLRAAAEEALLCIWAIEDGDATWDDFLAPSEATAPASLVLQWSANTRRELECCAGWVQAHAIAILRRLGAIPGLAILPATTIEESGRLQQQYRIGLEASPAPQQLQEVNAQLSLWEEAFQRWPDRPSGALAQSKLETGLPMKEMVQLEPQP